MDNASCWFPKNSNQKILKPGIYKASLKSVTPGIGKGYEKDVPRPTLMFSFQENVEGAFINRTCTASNSAKAQLLTLVRSMAGPNPPDVETVSDPEKLKEFILGLVGKTYLIQVEPSKDGRYNNLITAFPAIEPARADS